MPGLTGRLSSVYILGTPYNALKCNLRHFMALVHRKPLRSRDRHKNSQQT
jgi:hypothetical protein